MMAARGGGEEYHHQYDGPQYGLLMAVVLGLVIAGPMFLVGNDDSEGTIKEAVKEILGPMGLLLLPVGLLVVIRVLSSDRGAAAFADVFNFGGTPDTVHRVGGSPVGVALFLLMIVMLLYYRSVLFGGDDGDDE